jgi:predicted TIM-barrel fold metal-dependent hydrolase
MDPLAVPAHGDNPRRIWRYHGPAIRHESDADASGFPLGEIFLIIDVHHHFLPKRFFDNMQALLPPDIEVVWEKGSVAGRDRGTGYTFTAIRNPACWYDANLQLSAMDEAKVDHAVLSAACYQDWMTIQAARVINDGTAELVSRHPDRFSGMISVPPDLGDDMVAEIRRARDLGLCAINLTTTHRGRYPDHEDFQLLFETATALKLPIYMHPSWHTPLAHMDRWDLDRAIGKPTDLNLGIANLMFGGRFNDLPGLRMLFAHLGGSFLVTLRRLFYGQPGWLDVPDYDYPALLKRLFVDTAPGMWWSPIEIECAARIIGADQILMGSDYPLSNDPAAVLKLAVENVRGTNLLDSEKESIFGANAIALFGLHHLSTDANVQGHRPASNTCCD